MIGFKMMVKNSMKKTNAIVVVFSVLFSILFLTGFTYYFRGQKVYEGDRTLYMDDLFNYEYLMGKQDVSFWSKITDSSFDKVRYVSNFLIASAWEYIGNDFDRIDNVLYFSNTVLVVSLFVIFLFILNYFKDYQIQKILIALLFSIAFISSRFAYYSFEELNGIMENMGTIFAILILMLLIKDRFEFTYRFYLAHFLYFIIIYIHERYIGLVGVFFAYSFLALVKSGKKAHFYKGGIAIIIAFLSLLYRFFLFGDRMFMGTENVNVTDTFSVKSLFEMIWKQIHYLIGIPPRDDRYLNGLQLQDVSPWIIVLTIIIWIMIAIIFIIFSRTIRNDESDVKLSEYISLKWGPIVLCMVQIFCQVVVSSTTIRVEMRWIYASFGVELIVLSYMISFLSENKKEKMNEIVLLLCISICGLIMIIESYYVSFWKNIYNYFPRIDSSNFVNAIDSYDTINYLYILTDDDVSFDPEELIGVEKKKINSLIMVNNINEIPYELGEDDVVLARNGITADYNNITDSFKTVLFSGECYPDGWCGRRVSIIAYPEKINQMFVLDIYRIDKEHNGSGKISIFVNSVYYGTVVIGRDTYKSIELLLPQTANEITLYTQTEMIKEKDNMDGRYLSYLIKNYYFKK
ncbi:MAG: hypothetical protein K6B70_00710 [Clostridia bacterium]|nr:hypothetical protein [Clostridia bacterium]